MCTSARNRRLRGLKRQATERRENCVYGSVRPLFMELGPSPLVRASVRFRSLHKSTKTFEGPGGCRSDATFNEAFEPCVIFSFLGFRLDVALPILSVHGGHDGFAFIMGWSGY